MKTFHCYKPEERQSKLVPLIASLTTYDVFYKISEDDDKEDDKDDSDEVCNESFQHCHAENNCAKNICQQNTVKPAM